MGTHLKFKKNDFILVQNEQKINYGIYKIVDIIFDTKLTEWQYFIEPIIKFVGVEAGNFYATSWFEECSFKINNPNMWKLLYG